MNAMRRLTTAQAIIGFLKNQYVERDGRTHPFFAGMLGIFGHGNVAGIGQALQQNPDFPYIVVRNEQAAVHVASGFSKASNRLRTFACTSSIGPGATNMITGAALATINRLPVLLLPGDIFARRNVAPVLQQLESPSTQDIGVNDCFKPVSRYWDRIYRPEQIITSLPEAMRVLTSPADTGAVTLALPQDVQAEAFDFPEDLFRRRVWLIRRPQPDAVSLKRAVEAIKTSERPLLIAGGGVLFSEASGALASFAAQTGIPVGETQAGKGSLPYDHPQAMGAIGATGTSAANRLAHDADLIIGVGTRYSDFTTASMTAFQNPQVRFVNINVAEFDAYKVSAIPVIADAKIALEELTRALTGYQAGAAYANQAGGLKMAWEAEVDRLFNLGNQPRPAQSEVIGTMWAASGPRDMLLSAAGSHPGDLHKLWRTRTPNGYHMEYGYSCMGYEIPGAIGAKMADPSREVYVFLGDGTYLMTPSEIVTSIQEGVKLIIVLVDNHGFASIGGLSQSIGSGGFGTQYKRRDGNCAPRRLRRKREKPRRARDEGLKHCRVEASPRIRQDNRPHHGHRHRDRARAPRAGIRFLVGRRGRGSVRGQQRARGASGLRRSSQEGTVSPVIAHLTKERLENFVDGGWLASNATEALKVLNPASAEVLAEVPLSPAQEVDRAAQAADKAFREWRRKPAGERIQPLFKLKTLLEENINDLARTITDECGKTFGESVAEMRRAIENVEVACGIPSMMQGYNNEDIAPGIDEMMIRQPLGVVAAIMPFNFPWHDSVLVHALRAGYGKLLSSEAIGTRAADFEQTVPFDGSRWFPERRRATR